MKIFLLHFDSHKTNDTAPVTVDACVISEELAQAEAVAREAIEQHDYSVGQLIAFSQLEEGEAASLSDYETALYLKALQRKPQVAVVFS